MNCFSSSDVTSCKDISLHATSLPSTESKAKYLFLNPILSICYTFLNDPVPMRESNYSLTITQNPTFLYLPLGDSSMMVFVLFICFCQQKINNRYNLWMEQTRTQKVVRFQSKSHPYIYSYFVHHTGCKELLPPIPHLLIATLRCRRR